MCKIVNKYFLQQNEKDENDNHRIDFDKMWQNMVEYLHLDLRPNAKSIEDKAQVNIGIKVYQTLEIYNYFPLILFL